MSKNFFYKELLATWSEYGQTNLLLYCVLSYCTVYIANLRLKQTRNYHTMITGFSCVLVQCGIMKGFTSLKQSETTVMIFNSLFT